MQSILILTLTLLILCMPFGAFSLECLCNTCQNEDESCSTSLDRDSMCYMSITRDKEPDGSFKDVRTYGCLSAGDSLQFMQCRVSSLRFKNPTYIKCCNDRDFCNENITEPTKEDDPRWAEEPVLFDQRVKALAILSFAIFSIVTVIVLIKLIQMIRQEPAKDTEKLQVSDDSLFTISDFEHFIKSAPQACNSLSTQSYLTSEGSCHKHVMDEASISIGSGVGNPYLTSRTIATTVSKGIRAQVGEGRFGRVIVGQYHDEDVAVKCFKMSDDDAWQREDLIFRWLNHDNIVRHISSELMNIESNGMTERWMFLEYCPLGSLCDFLDTNRIETTEHAVKIIYSIINGLNYLHEDFDGTAKLRYKPSIAHRDLKSKNILMKTPDTCCLADFGHSLIKIDDERGLNGGKYGELHIGTVRYMAPEILQRNEKLDYRNFSVYAGADIYQFALVVWEVCNRMTEQHLLPYDNVVPHDPTIPDMIKIVCEDQYRPPMKDYWRNDPIMNDLCLLMPECWRPNPLARMETLGVKKRLKHLCKFFPSNPHRVYNRPDLSKSPRFKSDFTC